MISSVGDDWHAVSKPLAMTMKHLSLGELAAATIETGLNSSSTLDCVHAISPLDSTSNATAIFARPVTMHEDGKQSLQIESKTVVRDTLPDLNLVVELIPNEEEQQEQNSAFLRGLRKGLKSDLPAKSKPNLLQALNELRAA